MIRQQTKTKLLICDLDNTLYDWVSYFVPSFYSMVDKVIDIIGCDREKLLDDFREVHRRYHDSEHPFALLETQTVVNYFKGMNRAEIAQALDPAFHAFNTARKKHLIIHSGVARTLEFIQQAGIKIVAHTDSQLFGVIDRLNRLNLTDYFFRIYCRERPRSGHPNPEKGSIWLDKFPIYKVKELSMHQLKPDPLVLLEICGLEGIMPHEAAYVGDSIARDILMAKNANVFSIWAKYGAIHHKEEYEKLVRITHWTQEEVEHEKRLKKEAEKMLPDFIAEHSFDEIISVLFTRSVV